MILSCSVCERRFVRAYNNSRNPVCGSKCKQRQASERKRQWWATTSPSQISRCRRRIAKNHARPALGKKGPRAPGWKGGRFKVQRDGYVYVYAPEHPYAKRSGKGSGGYVLEHRLVMEKKLGRYLRHEEDVHHKNGVKDDNRPSNLQLVSHFAHFEKHGCPRCGYQFLTK